MSVYEHTYKQYEGPLTPEWSRFLVIPRHAYRDVFRSKLFIAFFCACFVYPLVAAILIYLHHNVNALGVLKIDVMQLLPINSSFFETFVIVQGTFAFFLTMLVGPPLVSRDLSNNALPLYLCRPISRAEYVVGKMSVVLILLSCITWIPGLLLFLLQSYLEGAGWLGHNLRIAFGIFVGSVVWMLILALLSQAISAWVKWRMAASAALLGLFFIPSVFAEVINSLFLTKLGNLISLPRVMGYIWSGLFGSFSRGVETMTQHRGGRFIRREFMEPPLWTAWFMVALLCGICLLLLIRKVRAYEVVKS